MGNKDAQFNPAALLQALGPILALFPATAPAAPIVMGAGTAFQTLSKLSDKSTAAPTSGSPGMGFAMGGSLVRMTDKALKAKGDASQVDAIEGPSANFDDGEVIYDNFVFSNRLINPSSGKTFAQEADAIVRKIAKIKSSKGHMDKKTISNLERMLDALASAQEKIKEDVVMKTSKEGFALGGNLSTYDPTIPEKFKQALEDFYKSLSQKDKNLLSLAANYYTPPAPPPAPSSTPSPTPPSSSSGFTTADKIQAMALLASALPLTSKPSRVPLYLNRATFSRQQTDPESNLNIVRDVMMSALRKVSDIAPYRLKTGYLDSVAGRYGEAMNQVLTQNVLNNQRAMREYEDRTSQIMGFNAQARAAHEERLAQQQASYGNYYAKFLQSLVNFAASTNAHQSGKQYMDMLKLLYPNVFANQ